MHTKQTYWTPESLYLWEIGRTISNFVDTSAKFQSIQNLELRESFDLRGFPVAYDKASDRDYWLYYVWIVNSIWLLFPIEHKVGSYSCRVYWSHKIFIFSLGRPRVFWKIIPRLFTACIDQQTFHMVVAYYRLVLAMLYRTHSVKG